MFNTNYLSPLVIFATGLCYIIWPKGWRDCNATLSNMAWLRTYWAKTSDAEVRLWGAGIIILSIVAAFFMPSG